MSQSCIGFVPQTFNVVPRFRARTSESTKIRPRSRSRVLGVVATSESSARQAVEKVEKEWSQSYGISLKSAPDEEAVRKMASQALPLQELCAAAARVRNLRPEGIITFSPKVFIPLVQACRDECGYCVFASPPPLNRSSFMSLEEVLEVARAGARVGCTEALFTMGDKPELKYPRVLEDLKALGHTTTLGYAREAAAAVLRDTGLVPHINAGVMSERDVLDLRQVSGSQGLMLETTSEELLLPGAAHHNCPDKLPRARLATIEAAGRARVPFTSGLLVGIGERRRDRVDALLALRALHLRYQHIQEIIIQNFVPKPGTAMAEFARVPLEETLWTVAMARLVFGPSMSVQAPPNLTPTAEPSWAALLDAGINDWGGISPVTKDFVNPEAAWPHLHQLHVATAAAGFHLVPRLTVYPEYITSPAQRGAAPLVICGADSASSWMEPSVAAAVVRAADAHSLARASAWAPGMQDQLFNTPMDESPDQTTSPVRTPPEASPEPLSSTVSSHRLRPRPAYSVRAGVDGLLDFEQDPVEGARVDSEEVSADVAGILAKLKATDPVHPTAAMDSLEAGEVARLFAARGADFHAVCRAADALRRAVCGEEVAYVVNRNINYTNVCTYACSFCAFSKGKANEDLRGPAYTLPLEEITRRTAEAWDRGATEVCMQGGIHPDFDGDTYLQIVEAAKHGAPDMHIHAFSPLEVLHGATTQQSSIAAYLEKLRSAGLASLPGTAAEILDDSVRQMLCPDKLSTDDWMHVVSEAHSINLPTTATMMFGHLETPEAWAVHLLRLRKLQAGTGGFTEFVPLPFVHMESPVFLKGRARRGPTLRECVLVHAVARLVLHPFIPNIQASWVKMGPQKAAQLLACGANDMGGVLMNESITRAAGATHGQEVCPTVMEQLIRDAGRQPRQRTTLYKDAPLAQIARSYQAAELSPIRLV